MPDTNTQPPADDNVSQAFQNLLARQNNDGLALARLLFQENYQGREERRQLQQQLQEAQTRALQAGHVAVPQADAEALAAYRALGTLEALNGSLAELNGVRRNQTIHRAAGLLNLKGAALVRLLPEMVEMEFRQEIHDGKAVEIPMIKVNGQQQALQQYVENELKDFLPALKEQTQGGSGTSSTDQKFVRQPGGGGNPPDDKSDPVKARIAAMAEQAKQSNPLMKKGA
jgi:hypothetical protein